MTSPTTQGRGRLGSIAALAALLFLLMAAAASAATYNVTTTVDEEPANPGDCPPNAASAGCSLREAVFAANDSPENDTINVPAGDYVLTNDEDDGDGEADLDIEARNVTNDFAGTLVIVGNSARDTTIRSGGSDPDGNAIESRIFELEGGQAFDEDPATSGTQCAEVPGANLEIRNLRITRGYEPFDEGGGISVNDGGGDCNGDPEDTDMDGRLTVRESAITNNFANDDGGGIYNEGEVALFNSLVASNNTAPSAGAGIDSNDSLSMVNTTIVGNQARGQYGGRGGGLSIGSEDIDFDEQNGTADAVNVTIAFNDAGTFGGGVDLEGPEFSSDHPVFTTKNTIIAHNTAGQGGANCNSGGAFLVSLGNNLENVDTCGFDGAGDKTYTDAGLLGRANNGGPTDTLALRAESPARDAGTNNGCPATDQRLVTRPQGAACDIGAYELVPPPPGPPQEPTPPTVIREVVEVPVAFPRVTPRGLTLRVRKDRPTRRSLRLRSNGRVLLPAGLTAAQACTFGTVAIQVKANGKTVSTRIVSLRRNCTYSSRVTFNALSRIRNRTLTVRARFFGNDRLRSRFSRKRSAGRA